MTIKVKNDIIDCEMSPIFILKVLDYCFNVRNPKPLMPYFLKKYMIFQTSISR